MPNHVGPDAHSVYKMSSDIPCHLTMWAYFAYGVC